MAWKHTKSADSCSYFYTIGESRTDLFGRNLKILESSINDMKPCRKDTVLLVVANPVDALTFFTQKFSDLPKEQDFGSGTVSDSARLRGSLAHECGTAASSINAYILGEHGESQVIAWSYVSVGGIPRGQLTTSEGDACHIDRGAVAEGAKQKASAIIEKKGSTAFGIAAVVISVCKSILYDIRVVLIISHFQEESGICLSTRLCWGGRAS